MRQERGVPGWADGQCCVKTRVLDPCVRPGADMRARVCRSGPPLTSISSCSEQCPLGRGQWIPPGPPPGPSGWWTAMDLPLLRPCGAGELLTRGTPGTFPLPSAQPLPGRPRRFSAFVLRSLRHSSQAKLVIFSI